MLAPRRHLHWLLFSLILFASSCLAQTQQREDEIVASLAGSRIIIHVARDVIVFAAIDEPIEAHSVPPRLLQLDATHVGILLGASEWQIPAAPQPVRLDRDFESITTGPNQHYQRYPDEAAADLETLGVAFLEKLRPLVSQLHHKIDFRPDDPLLEVIILGFARDYGPEIWQVEYRIEQQQVAARGEYWQTRILRPRFTQLYPPEGKHSPRTLIEIRYPDESPSSPANNSSARAEQSPPLITLIQSGDSRISRLRSSDVRIAKVIDAIEHGQAQKATPTDAADFLRAALPLIAPDKKFFLGTMEEQRGFDWIVPPDEPVQKTNDKIRPPGAPSLRRKPTP
ncbi:MAG: hypothetical protein M3N22_03805 [Acidobacteriota bacterium]|nr:hypothetical protein [Acidobacteriota bacterium]